MTLQRTVERTIFLGSNNPIVNEFSWRATNGFREGFVDFLEPGNAVNRYALWLEGISGGPVLDTTSVDGSAEIDVTLGRGQIVADLSGLAVTPGEYNARIKVWRPSDTLGWLIADQAHPLNRLLYKFVA